MRDRALPAGVSRRVVVNLIVLGLIGVALAAWAATNVLSIDAITRPYTISGDFPNAVGLQPRFEVAYLGVAVGSVSSVSLSDGHDVVRMKIDHGITLPVGLTAAASRASVVGEPYVELSPPLGYPGKGPFVRPGYVIPASATSVPVSYKDVFTGLDRLLQAAPPQALGSLVHELAVGLDGRGNTIRQIIENTDALTTSLGANSGTIDQAIGDLTTLSQTLADHSGSLTTSLNNLATVSQSLAQSRQQIDALLSTAPGFTGQLATVLNSSDSSLGCILDALGQISTTVANPQDLAALETVLDQAPGLMTALGTSDAQSPIGEFFHGSARFNVNGPTISLYATPQTLPGVPTVPLCPAGSSQNAAGPVASTGAGGQAGAHAGTVPVPTVTPRHGLAGSPPSPNKRTPPSHALIIALAIAAIVLILIGLVLFRPWRLLVAFRPTKPAAAPTPNGGADSETADPAGGAQP